MNVDRYYVSYRVGYLTGAVTPPQARNDMGLGVRDDLCYRYGPREPFYGATFLRFQKARV